MRLLLFYTKAQCNEAVVPKFNWLNLLLIGIPFVDQ